MIRMEKTNKNKKISDEKAADILQALREDLYAFCFSRLKDHGLAEEITQETSVRFLKAQHKNEIDNPRAYIFRIAFNLSVNHFRQKKIRAIDEHMEMDETKVAGTEVSPEEWLRYKQFRDKFNTLYGDLSKKQQEIFYLRRMEGLTTAQIGQKYNISRRMVQKYMAQVIRHFHKGLSDE